MELNGHPSHLYKSLKPNKKLCSTQPSNQTPTGFNPTLKSGLDPTRLQSKHMLRDASGAVCCCPPRVRTSRKLHRGRTRRPAYRRMLFAAFAAARIAIFPVLSSVVQARTAAAASTPPRLASLLRLPAPAGARPACRRPRSAPRPPVSYMLHSVGFQAASTAEQHPLAEFFFAVVDVKRDYAYSSSYTHRTPRASGI